MSSPDDITRIRVHYSKGPSLRFTGHLDMQRLWERLLRRSKLPLRYSQGYHPRARLNLASALPLGFTSEAELLDFWMNEPLPPEEVRRRLVEAAPPGLTVQDVRRVNRREDALQTQMAASEYEVAFFDPQDRITLKTKVQELLAQKELIRTRRKKPYDLRPLILDLEVIEVGPGEIGLRTRLNAEPAATGRPDEVLEALGFANTDYLVRRTKLILSDTPS